MLKLSIPNAFLNSYHIVNECVVSYRHFFLTWQVFFFLSFQSSCSFTVNSSALSSVNTGNYAVALQIEDFIDSSSTVPLSSVPLQFVIFITVANPIVISSTPSNGSVLKFVNGLLEFTARARVHCPDTE